MRQEVVQREFLGSVLIIDFIPVHSFSRIFDIFGHLIIDLNSKTVQTKTSKLGVTLIFYLLCTFWQICIKNGSPGVMGLLGLFYK